VISTLSLIPISWNQASARKTNSRGATGHLKGSSAIFKTRRPPSQLLKNSLKATAPSTV